MAFDLSEVLKDVSTQDTGRQQIQYIDLGLIDPDPDNFYSLEGLEELAGSIEMLGLQQPLLVRPAKGGRYTVISGHRRRAALLLIRDGGSQQFADGVPCIVDRSEASAALQELKLIMANSDTRKMSSADQNTQAERIEDLLRQLVDEGLLVQQRGRGTFVVQPVMARPTSNNLLSFGESMSKQGVKYTTKVVKCEVRPSEPLCSENLQIELGSLFLYLCRVRYVRRRAVMFIESHLNLLACPGLEKVDFEHESLFAAVERTSRHKIGRSEMVYTARTAGKVRGGYLECDEHAPVLELDQLVRLDDGTPFEWGSVWLPANRCVISNETRRA
jgi:DNA-binding GntR family transcriptional regulator